MKLYSQLIDTGTKFYSRGTTGPDGIKWTLDTPRDLSVNDGFITATFVILLGTPAYPYPIDPASFRFVVAINTLDASTDSGVRLEVTPVMNDGNFAVSFTTWYTSLIYAVGITYWLYADIVIEPVS